MESLKEFVRKNPTAAFSIAAEVFRQIDNLNTDGALNGASAALSTLSFLNNSKESLEVSVILPIYNEEENLNELYRRLTEVLKSKVSGYEIIFVNDGSRDNSKKLIAGFYEHDKNVKLINFSRNFGHQAAFSAGIDYCRGEAVILMDSDLQDPPEVLPEMIDKWRGGADVVYAVRKKRKETAFKKSSYFFFYRFLQLVANIDIPLDSGDFCLMNRRVVEELKSLPERNRFLRGLRSWVGFEQAELCYERDARFAGEPKYNYRKLAGLALNGIISFSSFPLRLATYLGFLTFLLGIIFLSFIVVLYFISGQAPQGWTSLTVIVLLVGGVQLVLLGAIGEYIARIYDETKQRPNYIVKDSLNLL